MSCVPPNLSSGIRNTAMRSKKGNASLLNDGVESCDASAITVSFRSRACTVTLLILFLGLGVSGAFLGMGVSSAKRKQIHQFERSAVEFAEKIKVTWELYLNAAAMVHGRCRSRNFTRQDFRELYEYLIAGGLRFHAVDFVLNITHEERAAIEAEGRDYFGKNYPNVTYLGITGFNAGSPSNATVPQPRDNQTIYYTIHYTEPVEGNEDAIGLDVLTSGGTRKRVFAALEQGLPALTDRMRWNNEKSDAAYSVILSHPGYNVSSNRQKWPRDFASIMVRMQDLISESAKTQGHHMLLYLFDKADYSNASAFLGGALITPSGSEASSKVDFLPEIELADVRSRARKDRRIMYRENDIIAANKIWTICVQQVPETFQPDISYVVIGGVFISIATVCVSVWVFVNTRSIANFHRMKAEAEAERTSLILDSARKSAEAERELNDFIAHEVRNPVAAALSACSFVKSTVHSKDSLCDDEQVQTLKEDVHTIDSSLRFVNDLLRNMLDMHRASKKQLEVTLASTDVLHDVLEPVRSMLFQRSGKIAVIIDCPADTFVMADRLRLNQVILNLGRNSYKFIHDEGFIRFRARKFDGYVEISVEDSGPGIPLQKRSMLFQKYQESLDVLSQGTGIGLFLSKTLVTLMGGDIKLDESYDSGIPGSPGARFVLTCNAPVELSSSESNHRDTVDSSSSSHSSSPGERKERDEATSLELPESLSVLFVDDDPILRKLFTRTVQRIAPDWIVREASNGETALLLVDTNKFDLIFMDMYMASVQKQLLGTETVRELRARGIDCCICGLSANDKETEFLDAGADAFTFKPFPCERRALMEELCRILSAKRNFVHSTKS